MWRTDGWTDRFAVTISHCACTGMLTHDKKWQKSLLVESTLLQWLAVVGRKLDVFSFLAMLNMLLLFVFLLLSAPRWLVIWCLWHIMCGANREMTDRATATHRVGKYRVLTSSFETCALPSLTVPVCWQPFLTYHRNVMSCYIFGSNRVLSLLEIKSHYLH